MTLYILAGLSRAREFGVEVPQDMVVRAWSYLHRHYLDEMVRDMRKEDCCWETVTLLDFVLSNYEDTAGGGDWTGGVFTEGGAPRDARLLVQALEEALAAPQGRCWR